MADVFSTTGKAITAGLVSGVTALAPKYAGWGTGAGTSAAGDTTLFTEDSAGSPTYARIAGTQSRVTTTGTNDTAQCVSTITANASKTITNAGLFDALTTGNIFQKHDFTGIPLNNGDSIQFTFQLKYS